MKFIELHRLSIEIYIDNHVMGADYPYNSAVCLIQGSACSMEALAPPHPFNDRRVSVMDLPLFPSHLSIDGHLQFF